MQVFDGHNDVLSRLWRRGDDPAEAFEKDEAHINAKACKAGGFAGGFFAIYCPEARKPAGDVFQDDGLLEEPLPDPLEPDPLPPEPTLKPEKLARFAVGVCVDPEV